MLRKSTRTFFGFSELKDLIIRRPDIRKAERESKLESIANLLGFDNFVSIMNLMAECMLQNLLSTNFKTQTQQKLVVDFALETLTKYSQSYSSCQMLQKSELMNRLTRDPSVQAQVLHD